jgi:hypothetical protein
MSMTGGWLDMGQTQWSLGRAQRACVSGARVGLSAAQMLGVASKLGLCTRVL